MEREEVWKTHAAVRRAAANHRPVWGPEPLTRVFCSRSFSMSMAQEQRSKHAHGYACKHTHTCFRQITRIVGSVSVYHLASYGVVSMCVCLCMYLISCNLHSIQAAKSLQLFMDKSSDWMITMRTRICSLTHIINGGFVVLLTVETVNCSKSIWKKHSVVTQLVIFSFNLTYKLHWSSFFFFF